MRFYEYYYFNSWVTMVTCIICHIFLYCLYLYFLYLYKFTCLVEVLWPSQQYEPRHKKTCLRGLQPGKTNRPAQPKKTGRGLKFQIQKLEVLYYPGREKNKALICTFIVCICHKQVFSWHGYYVSQAEPMLSKNWCDLYVLDLRCPAEVIPWLSAVTEASGCPTP